MGRSSPRDGHDPPAPEHVVELVGGVGVRVDIASALHLELVDQLEEATVGGLLDLAGLHHPPHRHRAVVLDDGGDVFDVAYVHHHVDLLCCHAHAGTVMAPSGR